MMRSRDDFPLPDGPTSAVMPGGNDAVTPLSASTRAEVLKYVLLTASHEMTGAAVGTTQDLGELSAT